MSVNGSHALEKRRRAEDAYRLMESRITDYKRDLQVATFEQSSTLKIDRKAKVDRTNQLKRENNDAVGIRRQCLADLLNDEMDHWRAEVLAKVETQVDKKTRLIVRAHALKDSREDERRRFVQDRYNELWRGASDDIRVRDSKSMTSQMSKERFQQIQDKIVRKQQLTNDENVIILEWNIQSERAQKADEVEKEKVHHAYMETAATLQDQIAGNILRKDREFQRLQQEADEELADIRRAMNIESETMKKRQSEAYATGRDNFNYNKRFKVLELEEEKVQKQHDKILLDYALKREREANQSNKDKKEELRASAGQYAKYLKEKALIDASELSIIEGAHKRDEECVLKARDDTLHVRQVAKDTLTRMVDEGRQEQIKSKKNQLLRDSTDGQNYSIKYLANAREGVEKEKADAVRRRGLSIENKEKVQDQISIRKLKSERDRQDAYLLDKRMKYIERTEQQRVAEQSASVRTYFPLKSSSLNI